MPNLSKTIEEQKERNRKEYTDEQGLVTIGKYDIESIDQITEQTSHAILKAVVEVLEEKKPIQGHSKECLGEYCDEAYCDIDERRVTAKTLSDIQTIINDVIEGK